MQKGLIVLGLLLIVIGLVWPWLAVISLGRLPGDIVIERDNFKIYLPITTMVLASAVLSLVVWFFQK